MVWPDRADPLTAYDVTKFYTGDACQYCQGQGHAFGGHPYSREGYLGNVSCPVCLGSGQTKAGREAMSFANNAPGGGQYGSPAIGGGGAVSETLTEESKKDATGLNFRPNKDPNKALGVGNAT